MRFFLFFLLSFSLSAQDSAKARLIIRKLCSTEFSGRGYVNDGCNKAASYLNNQFKELGLIPFKTNSYTQFYFTPVNTFPGKIELKINGKNLVPGYDFIVSPESKGIKTKGKIVQKDSSTFLLAGKEKETTVVIKKEKKLTWSVSTAPSSYCGILIKNDAFPEKPESLELNIEQKFVSKYKLQNIVGFVKGKEVPDSFIVISAHYDHLGKMGKSTYFPGANDNASGTALLLLLAEYFSSHPSRYSIAFMAFSGEEAGLLGSKYYTENPLFPLKQIRFLINLDLLGTGEEGATIVNATVHPNEFQTLNTINNEGKFLKQLKQRGKAQNSDHYFFTEKGVPAFFMYTMGGVSHYHDVYDIEKTLPLTEINDCFLLIRSFVKNLDKSE